MGLSLPWTPKVVPWGLARGLFQGPLWKNNSRFWSILREPLRGASFPNPKPPTGKVILSLRKPLGVHASGYETEEPGAPVVQSFFW